MKTGLTLLFASMLIFSAAFLPGMILRADDGVKFVDLDGDGINDNASDSDNNSIPDQAEIKTKEDPQADIGTSSFLPLERLGGFDLTKYMSNSERFGKLKSHSNALSYCRGGLEAGENFGPGSGIGSAAVSGGCPGGVCH